MRATIDQSTALPKAKKSFMQKLKEIKIDGEPGMSTNFERLDISTLERLASSEKSFKDLLNEMLIDSERTNLPRSLLITPLLSLSGE